MAPPRSRHLPTAPTAQRLPGPSARPRRTPSSAPAPPARPSRRAAQGPASGLCLRRPCLGVPPPALVPASGATSSPSRAATPPRGAAPHPCRPSPTQGQGVAAGPPRRSTSTSRPPLSPCHRAGELFVFHLSHQFITILENVYRQFCCNLLCACN